MNESPQYELLSAYLDGELSAEERARVERWLDEDPAARGRLDELRAVAASLKSLPVHRLGEDFSDRVLRAAEHRILAEPTALADAPRPSAERITARQIARRFLTPRAIAWSGLAVAVAILLSVVPFEPQVGDHRVARERKEWRPSTTSPVMVAADKPTESPVASEPAASHEAGYPAAVGKPLKAAEGEAHFAAKPTARALGEESSARKSNWGVPESRKGAAGKYPAATAGETLVAEPSQPRQELAPSVAKLKAAGRMAESEDADVAQDQAKGRAMLRRGPVSLAKVAAGTAVGRAAQNARGLLVVNCGLTPIALQKKAFAEVLALNRIDPVVVPAEEEHLAADLVTANFAQKPADAVKGERRSGQEGGRQWADKGDASGRTNGKASRYASGVAETAESKAAAGEKAKETMAAADYSHYDVLSYVPAGNQAEVVLVEGSPAQIAATLSALARRKDVRVSVPPHQADAYRLLQTQVAWDTRDAASGQSGISPSDFSGQAPERRGGQRESAAQRVAPAPNEVLGRQTLGGALADHDRAPQRGTAQRLGTIAMDEPPAARGAPLSPGLDSPSQQPSPAYSPAASQPPPTAAGVPPASLPPVQRAPAAGTQPTQERQQGAEGRIGLGMGGMGGMGLNGAAGPGTDAGAQEKKSAYGQEATPQTPASSPARATQTDGEPASDRGRSLFADGRSDATYWAAQGASGQPRQQLLQVLFVLQRIPDDEPPVAAATKADASVQSKIQQPAEPPAPASKQAN